MGVVIALPERGRIFPGEARGRLGDVTAAGRVRMDTLARWLQDVAYDDVNEAGLADAGSWVVRRTRIAVTQFPRFDEHVVLQTFCSGTGPRWAQRRTSLTGAGGARVEADALWIFLDWETLMPARLDERFDAVYGEAAAGRRAERARLQHGAPPPGAPHVEWRFRAADVDLADHVNNAAYWAVLEEGLGEVEVLDATAEYRDAAQPGPARVVRTDDTLWVMSGADVIHASIRLGS